MTKERERGDNEGGRSRDIWIGKAKPGESFLSLPSCACLCFLVDIKSYDLARSIFAACNLSPSDVFRSLEQRTKAHRRDEDAAV